MINGRFGFWEVIALAAAIQGLLLAPVIWTHRRGNRPANRLLAGLLFLYSIQLHEIVLYWTRSLPVVPHLWGVSWFFPFLYGVLLSLYARTLTQPGFRLRVRHCLHLAPYVFFLLLWSPLYFRGAEWKRAALEASYSQAGDPPALVIAVWALQFLHFMTYVVFSVRMLRRSARDDPRFRWLGQLFLGFGATFACWFINGVAIGMGFRYERIIDYGASFAMTATIYAIGYAALRRPELFLGPLKGASGAKYERSTLSSERALDFERRLVEMMRTDRPYLDADLRLKDLAEKLEVPPHHLSQVINQRLERNFNDFVNRYRVEEAQALINDPNRSGDSLLNLAFEVGFNNKTSFNQAFKKHAGMTPSQFRDRRGDGKSDRDAPRREAR